MSKEILRRQAIFRVVMFFLITIVIGFVAGDLHVFSSMN